MAHHHDHHHHRPPLPPLHHDHHHDHHPRAPMIPPATTLSRLPRQRPRPTDTYDFSPFLTAPAVVSVAGQTGGPVILNIPETQIPSPLAANITPSTLLDLKEYLCGQESPLSSPRGPNKGRDDGWKGELEEGLQKTFNFGSGIGEVVGGNGKEKKKWGDSFGEIRGIKQGREIWDSWKRAWDLWNNYYIEGRENPVWIRSEYENIKAKYDEERTRRASARAGGPRWRPNRPPGVRPVTNPDDHPRHHAHHHAHHQPRHQPHHQPHPEHTVTKSSIGSQGLPIVIPDGPDPVEPVHPIHPVDSADQSIPKNQGGIAVNIPEGTTAVPVHPGGQAIITPTVYRTRASRSQPTDAIEGHMWRQTQKIRPFYTRTKQIHSTVADGLITIPNKVQGRKQRPHTAAIQRKKGDKVIQWEEAPMYTEALLERIINLDTKEIIVDWTPAPMDFETLRPEEIQDRAGIQRMTQYSKVLDQVHLDNRDKDGKIISRPLQSVEVKELWDTGKKKTLTKDQSVPGEDLVDAERITNIGEISAPLPILVLDSSPVIVWEEVDINPVGPSVSLPAQAQATASLRTSPRKRAKKAHWPGSGCTDAPAHTIDNRDTNWPTTKSPKSSISMAGTEEDELAVMRLDQTEHFRPRSNEQTRLRGGAVIDPQLDTDWIVDLPMNDRGDNLPPRELDPSDVRVPRDPTEDPIHIEEATLVGESGGFMPMKELPDYKAFKDARKRYAQDEQVPESELDDVLSNSVWRPRRLGEKELRIDIDEDIEDFYANQEFQVDGGVDCGRSPFPMLRSVVQYFRTDDGMYYKKRVWDQVRGTLLNMPTQSESSEPLTKEERIANQLFGDFYRDENLAPRFDRHTKEIFPLDIRRCDLLVPSTREPKPRPEDFDDTTDKIEYPWEKKASVYSNLSENDPWWVTADEERKRDAPPRRYPPKQCHHNSGELLHCDDTLWRHEVDRDENLDSRYFVTNLHGGTLIINGQEIKKGQIAGPLPPFAVIQTQGGQVSFWWGVGGRDWGEGPDPRLMDYSSQWDTLRHRTGWEKVGLTAGQVWNVLIKDRLKRESTGDNLADDEQWEKWKSTEAVDYVTTESKADEYKKKIDLSFWNGKNKLPHRLYKLPQPECFESEEDELEWLYTRAEPLQAIAKDPQTRAKSTIIIPDPSHIWPGSGEHGVHPPEMDAQKEAEKAWNANSDSILERQRDFTQNLKLQIQHQQTMALKARKVDQTAADRKRKLEDTIGRRDPKKVRRDVDEKEKLAEDAAKILAAENRVVQARRQLYGEERGQRAIRELQKRKLVDARELAPLLVGAKTQLEGDRITRKFNEKKRKEREQIDSDIATQNSQRSAAGLSLFPLRVTIPDDEVEALIKLRDEDIRNAEAARRRRAARLAADAANARGRQFDALTPVAIQGRAVDNVSANLPPAKTTAERAAAARYKLFVASTTRARAAMRLEQQRTNRGGMQLITPADIKTPLSVIEIIAPKTPSPAPGTPRPRSITPLATPEQMDTLPHSDFLSPLDAQSSVEEIDTSLPSSPPSVQLSQDEQDADLEASKTTQSPRTTKVPQSTKPKVGVKIKSTEDTDAKTIGDEKAARKQRALKLIEEAKNAKATQDSKAAKKKAAKDKAAQDAKDAKARQEAKGKAARDTKAKRDAEEAARNFTQPAPKSPRASKLSQLNTMPAPAAHKVLIPPPVQTSTAPVPPPPQHHHTPTSPVKPQTKEQQIENERQALITRAKTMNQTPEEYLNSSPPFYSSVQEYLKAWQDTFPIPDVDKNAKNIPIAKRYLRDFVTEELRHEMREAALDALQDIRDRFGLTADEAVVYFDNINETRLRTRDRYVDFWLATLASVPPGFDMPGIFTPATAMATFRDRMIAAGNWVDRIASQQKPLMVESKQPSRVVARRDWELLSVTI